MSNEKYEEKEENDSASEEEHLNAKKVLHSNDLLMLYLEKAEENEEDLRCKFQNLTIIS